MLSADFANRQLKIETEFNNNQLNSKNFAAIKNYDLG
jgi:hypothetical protein